MTFGGREVCRQGSLVPYRAKRGIQQSPLRA
jgi:hypothetical protein